MTPNPLADPHQIVIVGGGFGGLYAARALGEAVEFSSRLKQRLKVTLVDKRNFHLFQPLLYQVASGSLSPGDIASPLRKVLHRYNNLRIRMDEVIDIDPVAKTLYLKPDAGQTPSTLTYDSLILAPGGTHQYFGNDQWQENAPSLKTLEDALTIRRKILFAFEMAEKETDIEQRARWLTFVIVGGGPTGVELAGTLSELAYKTMCREFKHCDLQSARIILVEAAPKILGVYPDDLIAHAVEKLEELGVEVYTHCAVEAIDANSVQIKRNQQTEVIQTKTTLWTAGVKVSPLGGLLSKKTGAPIDRGGRLMVEPDLSLPGYPEIFILGDLANYSHQGDKPLPGLASVAMQQGKYIGHTLAERLLGKETKPFYYQDKGTLAIIGKNAAVAEIGKIHLSGFIAWFAWLFIHIFYLIGFENKVLVLFQWVWNYLTRGRSACLISEVNQS